jgi:hypothetical protein
MKARHFALAAAVAGLAGCGSATQTVTPADRELSAERRGLFGDLTWTVDSSGKWRRVNEPSAAAAPASATEQEEFKKWQESAGSTERKEFEDWRAWREWKRNNPK